MKTNYFITGWPLAFFVMAIFAACDKNDAGPEDNNRIDDLDEFVERNLEKVTADQGLAGTVIVEEGNCMPHVGEEPEPNPDCYRYPAERTIYIHEYTTNDQVTVDPDLNAPYFFSHVDTELVKTVTSDDEGFFQANLPPGAYSIFIREKDVFYANLWDSNGGIQPVVVAPDEVSTVLLKITHSAHY